MTLLRGDRKRRVPGKFDSSIHVIPFHVADAPFVHQRTWVNTTELKYNVNRYNPKNREQIVRVSNLTMFKHWLLFVVAINIGTIPALAAWVATAYAVGAALGVQLTDLPKNFVFLTAISAFIVSAAWQFLCFRWTFNRMIRVIAPVNTDESSSLAR